MNPSTLQQVIQYILLWFLNSARSLLCVNTSHFGHCIANATYIGGINVLSCPNTYQRLFISPLLFIHKNETDL